MSTTTTTTDIVPVSTGSAIVLAQPGVKDLLEAFLSGRSPATIEAYRNDLRDLATFLNVTTIDAASETVLRSGHGGANLLALRYKAHLIEKGLSASSINRKLAAVRSLVGLANTLGLVDWHLQVENMRTEKSQVTGVGLKSVRNLLCAAGNQRGAKGIRDRAIVRIFFDLALRRAEVCGLDLEDVDLPNQRVAVKRKGHTGKTTLSFPLPTSQALKEWIERRGSEAGPLFYNMDHRHLVERRRITTCGVYHVVRTLGSKAGFKCHPHQLRHDGITAGVIAAQASGMGIEDVLSYSGHTQLSTLMIYRDVQDNKQGRIAEMVASQV